MLRELRRAVVVQARRSGLLAKVADSRWRRERLLILCYHGISLGDEGRCDPELFMAPRMFRTRLEALAQGRYRVLPLGEAVDRLRAGELPARAVAITFDDGFADFRGAAYPLLQEFGFPATVYLRTDYAVSQLPVFPLAVRYMLWKSPRSRVPAELIGEQGVMMADTPEGRNRAFLRLTTYVRQAGLSHQERHSLAASLGEHLGVDYEAIAHQRLFHLMSAAEVQQLSPEIADVQLHTHRHVTPRDRGQFMGEIEENRKTLREMLPDGREFVHFCYPSGDYDLAFLPWLRELNVRTATIGVRDLATRYSEPLLLPRVVDTTLVAQADFEGWTSGLSAWLPRRDVRALSRLSAAARGLRQGRRHGA